MSQELITENPDILAYQALSRHLFTVFSQGPGGINGIKFSVTDPKHKEWLVKAEETFAKQTEIKPAFLEALETEPDIKKSWESNGGERGLEMMQQTITKYKAAIRKHANSPTSRKTSSATQADRDIVMGQSQSPTTKMGEASATVIPHGNVPSNGASNGRRSSTSQKSPAVRQGEDEQDKTAGRAKPSDYADNTPSPKAPRPTRSETAKSGSSQRPSEGSPIIVKKKGSTNPNISLAKRKSVELDDVEEDLESLYPKRRKAAIRADERVANLPKLPPKGIQDPGKPARKKPGRKPKTELAVETTSLPASSPPPGPAQSPEPHISFYDLHPEYANDNLQSVFSSGVAAFQKLLDMNAQGVFRSLDTVRASMDKADENGDGFDPPTQLEQIALVFGRMEGLIQGGVMPTPD